MLAERNTRKIYTEKEKLQNETVKLEKDKIKIKQSLGIMELEANSLRVEMIINEEEIPRYDSFINL